MSTTSILTFAPSATQIERFLTTVTNVAREIPNTPKTTKTDKESSTAPFARRKATTISAATSVCRCSGTRRRRRSKTKTTCHRSFNRIYQWEDAPTTAQATMNPEAVATGSKSCPPRTIKGKSSTTKEEYKKWMKKNLKEGVLLIISLIWVWPNSFRRRDYYTCLMIKMIQMIPRRSRQNRRFSFFKLCTSRPKSWTGRKKTWPFYRCIQKEKPKMNTVYRWKTFWKIQMELGRHFTISTMNMTTRGVYGSYQLKSLIF